MARSASTTAYAATMAELAAFANTAYTPNYYTGTPSMDATGAAGTAAFVARGDHVHPSDTSRVAKGGDTMTGLLTLSGAPTSNLHAATKLYVDGSAPVGGPYLPLAGGILTGALTPVQPAGLVGTTTNNNATAGSVGEFISSNIAAGSAVSLTNGISANVTSIALTGGDWDVFGNVTYSGTTLTSASASLSTVSATVPTAPGGGGLCFMALAFTSGPTLPAGMIRVSTTGTTIYLVAYSNFTGANAAYGFIGARRAR